MGIFDEEVKLWNYYRVTLQFREKLMGGVPKDPNIIEGWLRSKAGITNTEEVRQATLRTLLELGYDVKPDMTYDEMVEASKEVAGSKLTNGFKNDANLGLYIEGRQIKAALKESINIHFAGERWGRTKKGPKSYTAERTFVLEDRVPLGIGEPSGVELFVGHVSGPQGERSTLTYFEYAMRPRITFHFMESKVVSDKEAPPSLSRQQWATAWVSMQEQGIGALRSQGHGRFDVEAFDEVPMAEAPKMSAITEKAFGEIMHPVVEAAG
jgi:hypothetical protein